MTDCNSGWGGILAGGLVGYLVGANGGGLFGNNNCGRNNCGCEDRHHGYDEAKLNDIMNGQDTKAILDATIAGDSQVRADIGALTKDVYSLNIQQLINGQSEQRNIDNQFCKTREFVAADGTATRAAIGAFETRYLEDRIHDRDLMIAKLQNELTISPIACGLAAVNAKLDAVMCPGAVKTCGSGCGCGNTNPFTIPPLVGTATNTQSYNPSIPTA
jgi:hypothetical protein